MADPSIAFDTVFTEHPDFNTLDAQAECERLFFRQKAIQQLTSGELDAETLLDILESQDINPTEYVDAVEENLSLILPFYG